MSQNDNSDSGIKKGKRGRKTINKVVTDVQVKKEVNESIVIKMPIQLSDLVEEVKIDDNSDTEDLSNVFIKTSKMMDCDINNNEDIDQDMLKTRIQELETIIKELQNDQIGIKNKKVSHSNLHFCNNKNEKIIWPEKVNCRCWWDGFKFNTPPVPIPLLKNDKEYIITDGIFCSFNCAMAYLLDRGGNKAHEQITLLNQLYKDMYDKTDKIYPASSWKCIDEYGGNITIDKFRNELINLKKEHIYYIPPLKSLVPQIEESTRMEFTETDKFTLSVNSIDTTNLTKLKRTKPIINNKYQLDKTMGLKIKKKKTTI